MEDAVINPSLFPSYLSGKDALLGDFWGSHKNTGEHEYLSSLVPVYLPWQALPCSIAKLNPTNTGRIF